MTSGEVYREDQEAIIKENYKEEEIDMSALRKIEFYDTVHLVGDEITEPAGYIKDKTIVGETAIICGKIRHIKERVVNRKPKQDPESENNHSLENVKMLQKIILFCLKMQKMIVLSKKTQKI